MNKFLFQLVLLVFPLVASAQIAEYSRAKVFLYDNSINELAELGVEVDHGEHMPHRWLVSDYSTDEIAQIRAAGFEIEILIEDVVAYYQDPNRGKDIEVLPRVMGCDGEELDSFSIYPYVTPENYKYGSMQGYLLYEEMLAALDDMKAKYPNLITEKQGIGDYETNDGNKIFFLKISDNPNVEEDEPEILYNAVHHAREPNSMSQLIFYMWYLLENYETDDYVKFLVDNTEMYFVPCLNPDGYIKNQVENPDGGGLWRKNTWKNEFDQVKGVDLNRNYGYFWAYDDTGSSPNENNQTYRGEEAFSEVETQAMRDLCLEHDFKLALNYHSFGNLLIHPWGYSDMPTAEDSIFKAFGTAMNIENDFVMGTGTETVGYIVNGDSDDWLYGEQTEKNKIYSYTPEIGSSSVDGFWPRPSAIDYLNRSAMRLNLTTAHISVDKMTVVESNSSKFLTSNVGDLYLDLHMLGMLGGEYTVSLKQSGFITDSSPDIDINLGFFERENITISYALTNDIPVGETVTFEVIVTNGKYTETVEIEKTFLGNNLEVLPLLEEDFSEVANWQSNEWGLTQEIFLTPPFAMTDSEGGNYQNSSINYLRYTPEIDLTDVTSPLLSFWARWEIEEEWDYVQISASENGIDYQSLCGIYTNPGSQFQVEGEPLYDGTQSTWVREEIDLKDYVGKKIFLRFVLAADQGLAMDGFYFDDFKITTFKEEVVSSTPEEDLAKEISIVPNPVLASTRIEMPGAVTSQLDDVRMYDNLGRQILQKDIDTPSLELDLTNVIEGMYLLEFRTNDGKTFVKKLIKS